MSEKAKILFDECSLGRPVVASLASLIAISTDAAELAHVIDKFGVGAIDEDWIPQVAEEGWIVITADAGKNKSKGRKLPEVCAEFRVSCVIFSSAVHRMSSQGRLRAIHENWEEIIKIQYAVRGNRYSLRKVNADTGRTNIVLTWSPPIETTTKQQRDLFTNLPFPPAKSSDSSDDG